MVGEGGAGHVNHGCASASAANSTEAGAAEAVQYRRCCCCCEGPGPTACTGGSLKQQHFASA